MKSCVVCSKELSGYQIKYCSVKCYWKIRTPWERKHYRKHNPFLPNRDCVWCGKSFRPRGEVHVCCDKKCRIQLEQEKAKIKRKETPNDMNRWGKDGWVIRLTQAEPALKEESMPLRNSQHKSEIEEYLANGGKIKSLPKQASGRIPEVNVNNLSGWSVETLFGFGYELQLMDELSSASEVGDVN